MTLMIPLIYHDGRDATAERFSAIGLLRQCWTLGMSAGGPGCVKAIPDGACCAPSGDTRLLAGLVTGLPLRRPRRSRRRGFLGAIVGEHDGAIRQVAL